ncbi:hypothetical protein HWV62_3248 [Athelia sp. TMB]|nr:hypothetical protein HWV62_3248 [Athelia sp. TMB]
MYTWANFEPTQEEEAFYRSLLPKDGDYPMAPPTVSGQGSFNTSGQMVLDDSLLPPNSLDSEELQPYGFGPNLMLPRIRSESESPSPSSRRTLPIPFPVDLLSHSPRDIITTPTPSLLPSRGGTPMPPSTDSSSSLAFTTLMLQALSTDTHLLPNSSVPGADTLATSLSSIASIPSTPISRKLVTYSSNHSRGVSSVPKAVPASALKGLLETQRDENVEARRAAFAALRHGQISKKTATPLATPLGVRGTDTFIAADRAAAAALQEGQAARDARMAAATKLSIEAMKKAEVIGAEAFAKRDKAMRVVAESKAKSVAAKEKHAEAAALHKASMEAGNPQPTEVTATAVVGKRPTTVTAAQVVAEKVSPNVPSEKDRRNNEAQERKKKVAQKKKIDADAKIKRASDAAARTAKIAHVAALSLAAKAAAAPAGSHVAGLTADCPQWMDEAVTHLRGDGGLGLEWDACVKAWVLLEIAMCFADSGSHGSAKRPDEVAVWIKSARRFEKPPPYHSDFGASCILWWMHLQPLWRTNDGDIPHSIYACDDGDWGTLKRSGKNGLFMVLLVMSWWARGAGNIPPVWTKLLVDIRLVLESMAATPSAEPSAPRARTTTAKAMTEAAIPGLKRAAGDTTSTRQSKRARRR